ncbi:MAG: methyl-accepting chemotaxis protein [Lachnospiraceae bacterium]|nr:methyl-accepting chemotaxis protein [Lachnospiraceae bacterium]
MKRQKIRTQLLLMCICPLILLGIVIAVFTSNNAINETIERTEELNQSNVQIIQNEFTAFVKQNIYILQTYAVSPTVVGYLKYGEVSGITAEQMQMQLKVLEKIIGDGYTVALTDAKGMQIFSTADTLVDVSQNEAVKQTLQSKTYTISNVVRDELTNDRVACLSVPVLDTEGNLLGVVQHNVSMTYLHNYLVEQKKDYMRDCLIVDPAGMVAAHSEHEITDEEEDRSKAGFMTSGKEADTYIADPGDGRKVIISYKKEPTTGWCYLCNVDLDTVSSGAKKNQIGTVVITLVMIVLCAITSIFASNMIMKPIRAIDNSITELSNGNFNKISGFERYKNEFGNIVRNTNSMTDKIHEIVLSVKEAVDKVAGASDELASTSKQISDTTDDVSESVQGIAKGATEQANTIQKAVENVINLSNNVKSVNDNATILARTARTMDEQSNASANQITKLSDSMNLMSTAMGEINDGIKTTGKAVDAINIMLDSIANIASQTSLLALNASIEAARAGDAGRGFAVVAEEIGNLATESAETADEIQREMHNLVEASNNSTRKANDVDQISQKVREILSDTVTIVDKLIKGVKETASGISTISSLSAECESSKVVITEAMEVLSSISQENAATSQETSASMEELNASVNLLADSADELNNLSEKLDTELQFFNV